VEKDERVFDEQVFDMGVCDSDFHSPIIPDKLDDLALPDRDD